MYLLVCHRLFYFQMVKNNEVCLRHILVPVTYLKVLRALKNNFDINPCHKMGWGGGDTFTLVRRFPTLPCFSSGIVFCFHSTDILLWKPLYFLSATQRDNSLRFQTSFPLRSQLLLIALRLRSLHNNFYLCGKTYSYQRNNLFPLYLWKII